MQHPMNDTAHITLGTIISGTSAVASIVLPTFQLVAAIIAIIAGLYAISHWRSKIKHLNEQHERMNEP